MSGRASTRMLDRKNGAFRAKEPPRMTRPPSAPGTLVSSPSMKAPLGLGGKMTDNDLYV
jgi:hypothetical protein